MSVGRIDGSPRRTASIASSTRAHGRRPSTTRSRPARSRVTQIVDVAEPGEQAGDGSPPDRPRPRARAHHPSPSTSIAARATASVAVAPEERDGGLPVAHLGREQLALVRVDVGRIRDDEVPRPVGKAGEEVVLGRARAATPVRTAFSRASASASREASIPVTRASGCSSAIASAIAPEPGPDVEHHRLVDTGEQREAALDDELRLGPRYERPAVDCERQTPEAPLAEDVLERLARCPPRRERVELLGLRCRQRLVAAEWELAAAHAEDVRDEPFGVDRVERPQRGTHALKPPPPALADAPPTATPR